VAAGIPCRSFGTGMFAELLSNRRTSYRLPLGSTRESRHEQCAAPSYIRGILVGLPLDNKPATTVDLLSIRLASTYVAASDAPLMKMIHNDGDGEGPMSVA
jgi:hypothetical protein